MQTLKLDESTLPAIYSPAGNASALLVLAHGAGADFEHEHIKALSVALNSEGISTLRFNFPFMQEGRRRVDNPDVCIDTIARAVATANRLCPKVRLFIGGHSFGGRMSTHYAVEQPSTAVGLILFSFPLHPSKKPAIKRAAHLGYINEPMLFLSGDRDMLAEAALLKSVTGPLANARLHWLETADHSYNILKRTRKSAENVYAEAARIASAWIEEL